MVFFATVVPTAIAAVYIVIQIRPELNISPKNNTYKRIYQDSFVISQTDIIAMKNLIASDKQKNIFRSFKSPKSMVYAEFKSFHSFYTRLGLFSKGSVSRFFRIRSSMSLNTCFIGSHMQSIRSGNPEKSI